jgi:integrase
MARAMIRKPTGKSRGKSVAWIPLGDLALDLLALIGPKPSGPVLIAPKGGSWHPPELTDTIHAAAKAAGISRRLHDLRGTYATQLYAAGLSYDEIEERMGWESGQARLRRRDYAREESVIEALAGRLKSFAVQSEPIEPK